MEQRQSGRVPRSGKRSSGEEKVVFIGPSCHRRFWKNGRPPRYQVWGTHAVREGLFFALPSEAVAFYAALGITAVEVEEE